MFSKKSLITSVVLVEAYIMIEMYTLRQADEYRNIKMVINHMDAQASAEVKSLEHLLRSETRRFENHKGLYSEYKREKAMIKNLSDNASFSGTTRGQQVMARYDLKGSDLAMSYFLKRHILNRKTEMRLHELISTLEKKTDGYFDLREPRLVLSDSEREYEVGQEYELSVELISRAVADQISYNYDTGSGYQEVTDIPIVLYKQPDSLLLKTVLTSTVTGETKTYRNKIYP